MATLFSQTKESLIKSFNKYRDYYDKKATAAPLKLHEYCVLLHPKLSNEYEKISNLQCKWSGLYRIKKVLTRSNYLIRKINTLHTQIIHRVRLKPIKPQFRISDLRNIDEKKFVEDPFVPEQIREPQLFDSSLDETLFTPWDTREVRVESSIYNKTAQPSNQPQPNLQPNLVAPNTQTPNERSIEKTPTTTSSSDSSTTEFQKPKSKTPSPLSDTQASTLHSKSANLQPGPVVLS